jgi:hypothetical protein
MEFKLTDREKEIKKKWLIILIISSFYNLINGAIDLTNIYVKNSHFVPTFSMITGYLFFVLWIVSVFVLFYHFSYKKMGVKFLLFYLIAKPLFIILTLIAFFKTFVYLKPYQYILMFFSYVVFAFFYTYSIKLFKINKRFQNREV